MKREKRTNESKKIISENLIELMKTSSFENITISSICACSTVSRNTFYRNFKNKDAILDYYLLEKCKYIIGEFVKNETYNPLTPTYSDLLRGYRRFYEYWFSNRELIDILLQQNLQNHLLSALCIAVNNPYSEEWVNLFKNPFNCVADYYYNWLASSLYSILISWAQHDFDLSAEEIADLLVHISSSINAH